MPRSSERRSPSAYSCALAPFLAKGSRPEDSDGSSLGRGGGLFAGAFFERGRVRAAIEKDEHARVEAYFVEILFDLSQPFGERIFSPVAPYLELERLSLNLTLA